MEQSNNEVATTATSQQHQSALQEVCQRVLGKQRLVIASNRGPVTFEKDKQDQFVAKRGSGGVVTALISLTDYTPVTWVAAALSEADREIGSNPPAGLVNQVSDNLRLHFVKIDPQSFDQYLNVISNPLLWFVQHEMDNLLSDNLDPQTIGRAWREGYVKANRQFAEAIIQETDQPDVAPFVILHDYQLYLAPAHLRQQRPDLKVLHFTHIPWPEPTTWQHLPASLVRSICSGLLACDIVGFQTASSGQAFVHTCQEFLQGVQAELIGEDNWCLNNGQGWSCLVRAYPISVDPEKVRNTYNSKEAQHWREKLDKLRRGIDKLIVRVDRLDPNKNVLAGFQAYRQLLEDHPDMLQRVTFLALLVPTRESVPEYADYKEQVFALINEINAIYGTPTWQPVEFIYGNDYARGLAALSLADLVVVNSVADGMNLVAKEASLVNERKAALVLSEQAGAWEELGDAALGVDPADCQATAATLYRALNMSEEERARRAARLAEIVEANDLSAWLTAHLQDLAAVQRENMSNPPPATDQLTSGL